MSGLDSCDAGLLEILRTLGLETYLPKLALYGVEMPEDILALNIEDLEEIGMKRVKIRLLQKQVNTKETSVSPALSLSQALPSDMAHHQMQTRPSILETSRRTAGCLSDPGLVCEAVACSNISSAADGVPTERIDPATLMPSAVPLNVEPVSSSVACAHAAEHGIVANSGARQEIDLEVNPGVSLQANLQAEQENEVHIDISEQSGLEEEELEDRQALELLESQMASAERAAEAVELDTKVLSLRKELLSWRPVITHFPGYVPKDMESAPFKNFPNLAGRHPTIQLSTSTSHMRAPTPSPRPLNAAASHIADRREARANVGPASASSTPPSSIAVPSDAGALKASRARATPRPLIATARATRKMPIGRPVDREVLGDLALPRQSKAARKSKEQIHILSDIDDYTSESDTEHGPWDLLAHSR